MSNKLIINSSPTEVRIAVLEGRQAVEYIIERRRDLGVVGNIYRGRVVRVLPGMQAAFVDLGLERTGFLYVNDALKRAPVGGLISQSDVDQEAKAETTETQEKKRRHNRGAPLANIGDILSQGQEILVQVQKDPMGTKGARLTRHVNIPGYSLVFMPFSEHVGVSRRIEEEERERLRLIMAPLAAEIGGGFIVRTAAEGMGKEDLEREALALRNLWIDVEKRGSVGPVPEIVFEDLDLVLRATRDLFTDELAEIVVDSAKDYERVKKFVSGLAPGEERRVKYYERLEPIFDFYGIEVEIERALERRVWLKSGGYLVIDQAEALTAIDINSGRFVGKSSLEDTITQINLEAVKEIAYQLRLRNLGGIIIVDFIDMSEAANRERVLSALQESIRNDKAKTTVVRMSEIGLVEMTRKRTRDSVGHQLTDVCPYCKGRGYVKNEQTVANEILRTVRRTLARKHSPTILINMDPAVADFLYEEVPVELEEIESLHDTQIIPVAREGFHVEHFEVVTAGS